MDANQLLIIDIQGSAGIVLEDGSIRALSLGDTITVGDIVITAADSSLLIDVKGVSLAIPANQRVQITPDLVADAARDSSETTIFDDSIDDAIASLNQPDATSSNETSPLSDDVSDFLNALEGDGDLLDSLEATAAGGNAASGSGGGTSFVELARIAEGVDPNSLSFDDSFEANNDGIFSVRDTTDGVVLEGSLIGSLDLNDLGLINNPQPVISGTSANLAGQSVLVTITDALNNTQTIEVVIEPDGTFTTPTLEPLPDGPIVIEVTTTDPDGNPISDTITADIDTTAPLVSIDTLADSASPVVLITGSVAGLNAGDDITLTVTDSNAQVQTFVTQVDEQGNWSITTAALAEGPYSILASAIDDAGNEGNAQATAVIDLTAPVIAIDAIADTNDSTPILSGVVSGVAAGTQVSIVVLDINGNEQTLTATVAADGSWSVEVINVLAQGEFTVTATVSDSAGNQAEDSELGVIDLTAPNIDIFTLVDTQDTTPIISGTVQGVPLGAQIRVVVTDINGQQQTLNTTSNADGSWSVVVVNELAEGQFTVTATAVDDAGNTASDTEVGIVDLTAPTISINTLADSNDTTPTVSGSTIGVNAGTPVSVVITDSNGEQQTIIAMADAAGNWQVEPTVALAEGDYSVTASVSDEAGNSSSATATGIIDLTAPLISINDIADTNDQTPDISGLTQGLLAGSNVIISVTDSNGVVQIFNTVTGNDGSWSISVVNPLAEGQFDVIAQTEDTVGNSAQDSTTGNVDLTAPIINIDSFLDSNDSTPVITGTVSGVNIGSTITVTVVDSDGNQQVLTGVVNADNTWQVDVGTALAEGEFTITATAADSAGNQATDTSIGLIDLTAPIISLDALMNTADDTPVISGQVQGVASGTLVSIVVVDANGDQQTLTAQTLADGRFAVEVSSSLAEGQYSVVATVVDSAGNQGSDNINGVIDLSLLSISIDLVGETNDTTPELTGSTLNTGAGDQVQVVITDVNGQTETLITTVDANGTWVVTPLQVLAEGEFTVKATITDSFGNTANTMITGIVDITAPTILIDTVGDINDSTPVISGTTQGAVLGSTVSVVVTDSQNTSQVYTATTDANGNWSIDVSNPVAQGEFTVIASVTDAAGNTGTDSEVGTLNNTNPVLTLNFDELTNDNTPLISGTSDTAVGSIVSVLVTDSSGNIQTLSAVVGADGSWSISPDIALSDGSFTVTASVEDSFGNQSTVTDNGVVDATAPTLSIDNLGTVNDSTPVISGQTNEPAGSVVNLVVDDGVSTQSLIAIVNADGSWSVEVPTALQNGLVTVDASITDAAGNQATAIDSFTLNDNAPSLSINAIADSNDVTPTISGTSDAPDGSIITVIITDSNNNSQTLTTTVTAGIWNVDAQDIIAEGSFIVDASITVDGLTSDAQAIGIIDTQAPMFDINPLAETNDTTPSITGSSDEIGGLVSIIVTDATGAIQTLTATVLADGTWSVDVPTALAEGAFQVDASVTDAAGNTASDTENGGVIDTQAPSFDIDPLSDSNDTTPSITGSSDEIGGLVSIIVTDATGAIQTLTATVLADGTWSVDVPTALAEGAFQVDASVTDAAGNTASDTENGGVIDTQAPSFDIDPLSDSNDTTPSITGSSDEIGGLVSIIVTDATGAIQTLTATVLADGTWSVDVPTALAEGAFQVDASVTDAAGNTASDTENGGVIDTQAPSFDIDPLSDSNDTTPSITGSSDEIGGLVSIIVTDATGAIQTLTATVLADGTWSVDVPTALAEGAFQVDASVTDAAGNTASDTENGGVIDTIDPLVTINAPALTNDNTPMVTGTSDLVNSDIAITFTDSNGSHTVTVQTNASGEWSAEATQALIDGAYTVTASISDAAGNTGSASDNGVVDTIPPELAFVPTFLLGQLVTLNGTSDLPAGSTVTVTQNLLGGGVINYTATTDAAGNWSLLGLSIPLLTLSSITASASDEAGNIRTINSTDFDGTPPNLTVSVDTLSNDNTPAISGTTDAGQGASVAVVVTDKDGNSETLTAIVDANGDWMISPTTPLPEGAFTVDVSVRDSVGNETTESVSGVIDTLAPTLTVQGVGDGIDVTPVFNGTSNEVGGTVTLIVTDANGVTQTLSAIVQSNGQWSVEVPNGLEEGDYTVDAVITDGAGNETALTLTGNIDTSVPIVIVNDNGLGNNATPTITGSSTEAAGTVVSISVTDTNGDVYSLSATVQADGTWQATAPTLPDGNYTMNASITDAAGNTGNASGSGNIDTQAPLLTINNLGSINDTTPNITGSSSEPQGTVINLVVTDSIGNNISLTATVDSNGNWAVISPTLGEDEYTVNATVSDTAGNTTIVQSSFTLNTTAPSIAIDSIGNVNDATPVVSGTSNAADGTQITVTLDDGVNTPETLITQVVSGVWTVTAIQPLAEGSFTVSAAVTVAGNTGTASTQGIVDTIAPVVEINPLADTNDTTPTISGTTDAQAGAKVILTITDANGSTQTVVTTVSANGTWSISATTALVEGGFVVVASVTDAAGNTGTDTENTGVIDTQGPAFDINALVVANDATPTISGTSDEIGGIISIIVTDATGAIQTLTATVLADGTWSVDVPTALAEGAFQVDASVTDAAGNTASDTENGGVIDTIDPLVTINAPALTNDNTPMVTGTSDLVNSDIAITFTDSNGSHTVTVQTNASGEWSAEATQALIDGAYTATASISDAAGNTGSASDNGVVDTIPPELAFVPTFLLGQLVTLNGTSDLPAGSTVTVTQNLLGGGVINYTATTDAAGNWSLLGLSIPLLTLSSITASASDEAGNIRTINSTDFDGTPPTLTVSVDTLSNDNTPAISGTTDAGQGASVAVVVTDKDGNSETLTAIVDANGDWMISPTTPLPEGAFTVDVSVRDSVGNETTESVSGVIDTLAPTLTVQGVGDGIDVTPVFNGTSNEVGGTVTLIVTDANGVTQTLSATVQSNGQWSVEVPNGLEEGDYTVDAVITDGAGNETALTLTGNIDTSVPIVIVNDNGLGNNATPTITGSSTEAAGTVVSISVTDTNGDVYSLSATVQADGTWQATAPTLPDGNYTMNASITDAAGNIGSDSSTGSIDTLDPLITINNMGAINDDTPTISGTSSEPEGTVINLVLSDSVGATTSLTATVDVNGEWFVTAPVLNDGDYSVVATVNDAAGNSNNATDSFTLNTAAPSITINVIGETNDTTPTINGSSDAVDGSVVTVLINDGINPAETVQTTVIGGTWSVTASIDLAEGDFTVKATVEDIAGNQGSATVTGIIDTTMPDITINSPADSNDTTPTISGTASAPQGSVVTLVFNDANGASHTVTTQMSPNGTWSVPAMDALAEGEYTVTASVSDQAGNPASASVTGLIDLTAPIISVNTLTDSSDVTPIISGQSSGVPAGTQVTVEISGANGAVQSTTATTDAAGNWSVEASNAIAEGEYTVNVSVTDSAGNKGIDSTTGVIDTIDPLVTINAPALTNDNTPMVTGTSDLVNSDIAITFTDSNGSHTVTVQTNASGEWSAEATQALIDGAYTATASISDAAGNTGSASDNGVVDTIPPELAFVPTFLLGQLVTLNGTSDLPAGSTVTVTQNLLGGGVINYTATTDAAGNWSLLGLSIPLLTLSSITASASDEAGNIRTINSTDFDGTPPTLTVDVAALSNDTTPLISGTTDAGQGTTVTVMVTDNSGTTQTLTATVSATGTWSVSPENALAQGSFSVNASVRDGVGNETTASDSGVIDSIAPTLTLNTLSAGIDLTPQLSGTSNAIGAVVTVIVTDSENKVQTLSAIVQSNGQWSVEVPNGLAQGSYTVTASISDTAGNQSNVNGMGSIDTVTPVVFVNDNGLSNNANPVISGTSTEPAGTVVAIALTNSNGDISALSALVEGDGTWQVTAIDLPDGAYTYTASITDAAGNTGSDNGDGSLDTLAPSLTVDNLGTINDSTPTISGDSDEPEGSVVTITVNDGTISSTFTALVQTNGSWSADVPSALVDGPITITASITDTAGNNSTITDNAILNTNAPSITINVIGETNDITPTINGTSDAADNSVVIVMIDDGVNPTQSISTLVIGGAWTVTASQALAEGDFNVSATVTEGGLDSTATRLGIIDTTMPDISINAIGDTNDTTPTISGTASAPQGSIVTVVFNDAAGNAQTVTTKMTPSGTWSVAANSELIEGVFTVTATVSDQAGNPASASITGEIDITAPVVSIDVLADSSDVTPTISGLSNGTAIGSTVNLVVTDSNGDSQNLNAITAADGSWSVEATTAIAEGGYTVVATLTDSAGNSSSDTQVGIIDTLDPLVSINVSDLTNDNTPLVTGGSDSANSDILVTFTDSNGSHSVTVQTDSSGNWSAEATQVLADGTYTVTASITDAAGNRGSASDNGVVDTVAPELRIIPSFLLGNLVSLSGESDLPPGSTVTITNHLVGGLIGASYTATTDENGNWQVLNLTLPLLTLAYVTASATDAAGNTITVSTLDFDNTAPTLSVSVAALNNDTTPAISGDTDMGEGTVINLTVVDSDNYSQTFTAIVQADNTWSASVPQAIAEGTYTVTASVRDGVGNLTTEQTTGVIDSLPPTLVINNLDPTANSTPTISGSSDETGGDVSVTIAGQTLQTTVAADGSWQVMVPNALDDGDYTVNVGITDDAGNLQTASTIVTIDSITPVLTMTALGLSNDATPIISGTSTEPEGTEVAIVLVDANNDSQQFTALVQADGSYSASPVTDIAEGNYTVTASITDSANNIGSAQGAGIVDTLNPSLTLSGLGTFNDSTPVISGSSDEIGATVMLSVSDGLNSYQLTAIVQVDGSWSAQVMDTLNDGAITITASLSDAAGNQVTVTDNATLDTNAPTILIASLQPTMDTTPTITGSTDARDGTDVTIQIIASGTVIQTVTTQASAGLWAITVDEVIAEGSYTVSASVSEDGLTGLSTTSLEIDLTAPTLVINTPSITNDTTPSISGSSDVAQGTKIQLLVIDSDGIDQTAEAIVNANGTWSIALTDELAEGSYTITATVSDIAGNSKTTQNIGEIDLTPPTVAIDPLSNTADKTPVVSGSAIGAVAGNTVGVTFTDAQGASHTVNTTLAADLTWQVEASQTLGEGAYTATAVVTDTAGNAGQQIANAIIDSINPEITIDQSSLVLTQDTTPLISGTSDEANATVVVIFTDADGMKHTVNVTTDAQGDWQAAANTSLAEGIYSVKASITDTAGNIGEDSKTGGEVDITPPELVIVPSFLLGNLISLSGTSDLPEGSVVTITNHLVGGVIGLPYTVTVDANGDWSVLNLSVSLLTLAYVEASATDAAGNTTTISTLDFDNTPPELTLAAPALSMDNTPTISGTTDLGEGAQVTLLVTGQGVAAQTLTATVQANGSWSVNVPQGLGDGQYSVKASVRDGVGNLTEQTASGVIDTTAPSLVLNTTLITSDDTPQISGTSNLTGGEVTVTIGGQTLTATVAQNGLWQVSTATLTDDTYTVTASVTDNAGNSTARTGSITIDTTAPSITVANLGLANDATPIITGTSDEAQGSTVLIALVDGNGDTHNLTAVVDINGDWQVQTNILPEGEYNVTVSITDAAGLTSSATTAGEVDTVAPIITVDALGTINIATPTITGASDEPVGTIINVTVTDITQAYIYTAQVLADGSWTVDVPDNLADGAISVVASVTDLAGNTSVSENATGVLNTSAPSIGISPLAVTNDTTPEISGTSDAPNGHVINLVVSNVSGEVQNFTTTLNAGVWSIDVPQALLEGVYTVTASVTESGLTSSSSASLVIDLTAPTLEITSAPSSADSTPLISGTSVDAPLGSTVEVTILDSSGATQILLTQVLANGNWSVAAGTTLAEGDALVTAVITDTAGNSSNDTATLNIDYTAPIIVVTVPAITNDWTPSINGTVSGAPLGALLTILITDSAGSKQTLTTTANADGSWSVEATKGLSDGNYTIEVSAADELGNTATSSTTGIIDTVQPVIAITSGLVLTADTTPLITGTSNETNSDITVIFDNGFTQVEVTTATDALGNWSISSNVNLGDANYTVTAQVTDDAGNVGTTSAAGLEVDTTPIDFEVANYYWGILWTGLTAEGTVEEGSSVYVLGTNLLGLGLLDLTVLESGFQVQPNASGEWSALLSVLDLGSWDNYRFVTVDEVGNYLVKDLYDNTIEQGNNSDLVATSLDTSSEVVLGAELMSEQQVESEPLQTTATKELIAMDESIDLSRILEDEPSANNIEPLDITIGDVLSDAEQSDVLALDPVSEENSIAFNSDTSISSEPALDVQNQSEEMIKKLIESSNNHIDS